MRSWLYEQIRHSMPFEAEYQRRCRERVRITVGMITYGRAPLLRQALHAIAPQLSTEVELVVVVDGPDRESLELLDTFAHPYVRVFAHSENLGRPAARNRVVDEAYGRFIIWMDDDDLPHPELVDCYLSLLDNAPTFDVANCNLNVISLATGEPRPWANVPEIASGAQLLQQLIAGRGIHFAGSLIRRSLYTTLGGFDLRFDRAQDYEFWFRAAMTARFTKVNRTLYTYRTHSFGASFGIEYDYSYESLAIRLCLQRVPLEELFPELAWGELGPALRRALMHIGTSLARLGDNYHASRYLERIPARNVTLEVTEARIRSALAIGDVRLARSAFATARYAQPAFEKDELGRLNARILNFEDLHSALDAALETGQGRAIVAALKELRTEYGVTPALLRCYAERFERIGDLHRATRFMRALLRLTPHDRELLDRLEAHAKGTRERGRILRLAERLRYPLAARPEPAAAGLPIRPILFRLRSLEAPGDPPPWHTSIPLARVPARAYRARARRELISVPNLELHVTHALQVRAEPSAVTEMMAATLELLGE